MIWVRCYIDAEMFLIDLSKKVIYMIGIQRLALGSNKGEECGLGIRTFLFAWALSRYICVMSVIH